MKKKNNDTKIAELTKKSEKSVAIEFNDLDLFKQVERKLNELPVLTEAELDELKQKADVFAAEMAGKGCWIGMGMFHKEGSDIPADMVQASGSVSALALLMAGAMSSDPALEQAFMLAVGLRIKHGGLAAEAEDDDMTDAAEAEEDGQAPGCELGEC